jgi:hypothetical protein
MDVGQVVRQGQTKEERLRQSGKAQKKFKKLTDQQASRINRLSTLFEPLARI